jgi:hypothetical protein
MNLSSSKSISKLNGKRRVNKIQWFKVQQNFTTFENNNNKYNNNNNNKKRTKEQKDIVKNKYNIQGEKL